MALPKLNKSPGLKAPKGRYEIKKGDTLSGIARTSGVKMGKLLKANPKITDPDKIRAGASLKMPGHGGALNPAGKVRGKSGQAHAAVNPAGKIRGRLKDRLGKMPGIPMPRAGGPIQRRGGPGPTGGATGPFVPPNHPSQGDTPVSIPRLPVRQMPGNRPKPKRPNS